LETLLTRESAPFILRGVHGGSLLPKVDHMSLARARRRPLLLLAVAVCLAVGLSTPALTSAGAATSIQYVVTVDRVYTENVSAPDGTPGSSVPSALVQAGRDFKIDISITDPVTHQPVSFNANADLAISAVGGAGSPMPSTVPVAGGSSALTLTTQLPTAANKVVVTVDGAGSLGRKVQEGSSAEFDVVSKIDFRANKVDFKEGIGGQDNCTIATATDAVCGIMVLPLGAASSQVLLSLGTCDDSATYVHCNNKSTADAKQVVQVLADLDKDGANPGDPQVPIYTTTNPATLILKCDKTLCGTGPIASKVVNYSFGGNTELLPAGPCPAKNTAIEDKVCIDPVQTNRDGSADTIFYLLFTHDARVTIG
jgi:hypothetical protein